MNEDTGKPDLILDEGWWCGGYVAMPDGSSVALGSLMEDAGFPTDVIVDADRERKRRLGIEHRNVRRLRDPA